MSSLYLTTYYYFVSYNQLTFLKGSKKKKLFIVTFCPSGHLNVLYRSKFCGFLIIFIPNLAFLYCRFPGSEISLNFCLSKKVSNLHYSLVQRILEWHFLFSFRLLKILLLNSGFHSLWWETYCYSYFHFIEHKYLFFLWLYLKFSFLTGFSNLMWCVLICLARGGGCFAWDLLSFFDIWAYIIHKNQKIFLSLFLQNFFCIPLFCLSFLDVNYIYVQWLNIFPQATNAFFHFFPHHYLLYLSAF